MNTKVSMKRLIASLFVWFFIVGFWSLCPADTQRWTPEKMLEVAGVSNVEISPDGRRVIYQVSRAMTEDDEINKVSHVFVADVDGGNRIQMTHGEKSCSSPRWSPDGEYIAFMTARSGKNNVWLIRPDGGESWQLTDSETPVTSFKWGPRGRKIAFTATAPKSKKQKMNKKEQGDANVVGVDVEMCRLWVVKVPNAPEKADSKLLTKGKYNVASGWGYDWRPDGREIAFARSEKPGMNNWITLGIYRVDVNTGNVRKLVDTKAAESSPVYSPDGKWIAYKSSPIPPPWYYSDDVYVIPSEGGDAKPLAKTPDRSPVILGWTKDGKSVVIFEGRKTGSALSLLPTDGTAMKDLLVTRKKALGAPSFNHSAGMAGITVQSCNTPTEAFVFNIDKPKKKPVKISNANFRFHGYPMPKTDIIRWKAKDGMEIEGLLTYPMKYKKGQRYPLLVIVHGGPAGVFRTWYLGNPFPYPTPIFAEKGYAVLRCNIRGSGGYGVEFRKAIINDWGGKDFQDIMSGIDHLIKTGVVDRDRLGIMGWSYGGYMTAWAVTQTDRFNAASMGAGLSNLVSFSGTADVTDFIPGYLEGVEFWEDPTAYVKMSPLMHVKNVKTPTLIIHGEADARVPVAQGYEFYHALKKRKAPVMMITYPRAGHGLTEPRQMMDIMKRNVEWFGKYVLNNR